MEVLVKDLRVFASFNEDLFKEITQLLTLENFRFFHLITLTPFAGCSSHGILTDLLSCCTRQNEQLSKYTDTKSARSIMLMELKKLIEANPLFRDKLAFPAFKASRLRTLINQRFMIIIIIFIVLLLFLILACFTCYGGPCPLLLSSDFIVL